MNTELTDVNGDEAEIRQMIAGWAASIEARDIDGLMGQYAAEAVLFDAIPPYRQDGAEEIRKVWSNCLPCFPDTFKLIFRDVEICTSGDAAFAHGLFYIESEPPDHPAGQTWWRLTVCYRRSAGKWKALHEHVSIPFNPLDSKAWFISDPETRDQPDYSQAVGDGVES